jgi:hypothetical protein
LDCPTLLQTAFAQEAVWKLGCRGAAVMIRLVMVDSGALRCTSAGLRAVN